MNYGAGIAYRQRAVEGASPVGLVVLLYGTIVASLLRAKQAIQDKNTEKRVSELNHVLTVIGQLQGTLDFERGGHVARHLDRFYSVMRARVLQASIQNSMPILEELVRHFTSLKEAWQEVERSTMGMPGTALKAAGGGQDSISL